MELEALQLPVPDLQGLDLQPPVPPPDQAVSRLQAVGKASWVGVPAVPTARLFIQLAQQHIL